MILQVYQYLKAKLNPPKVRLDTNKFFRSEKDFPSTDFWTVLKRLSLKDSRSELIVEPSNYCEFEWYIKQYPKRFRELLYSTYEPNQRITISMPKKAFTFRPIAYLYPLDSIVYQAIVDKLIYYKREKFSKQVYSNIINNTTSSSVFHNPVQHWLEMRENIRFQLSKEYKCYFFADISGYFENIKIKKLLQKMQFYVGRNEKNLLHYLERLLEKWSYAEAQGIIQPHHASSILAKIYLSSIDSRLSHLQKRYNRYVDEFHILAKEKYELLKVSIELNEGLRDLGLNLNAAKSEYLEGEAVRMKFDEDKDFFDRVNYLEHILKDYEKTHAEIVGRFENLMAAFEAGDELNDRVFRYCIRKFTRENDARAVAFCVVHFPRLLGQTVDIVQYLSIFINDAAYSKLITNMIFNFLTDTEQNLYAWVQIWLLTLLLKINSGEQVLTDYIWDCSKSNDSDEISRCLCFLILAKHLDDHDLLFFREYYEDTNSLLLKRIILFCMSRLPSTYLDSLLAERSYDELHLMIMKRYLNEQKPDFKNFSLI